MRIRAGTEAERYEYDGRMRRWLQLRKTGQDGQTKSPAVSYKMGNVGSRMPRFSDTSPRLNWGTVFNIY